MEATAIIVIDKLLGLLTDDTNLRGLPNAKTLKEQLKTTQSLIEKLAVWDYSVVNKWWEKVAKVVQDLEVVIDTYLLRMARRGNQPEFVIKFMSGRSVANEFGIATMLLREIRKSGLIFLKFFERKFERRTYVESPVSIKESEVVAFDSQTQQLVSVLLEEPSTRLVISLVGSFGVGKTILASMVYRVIKGHFECRAWIRVSKSYNLRELLRDLATQIIFSGAGDHLGTRIDRMNLQELSSHLNQYLQTKRYVIIFDDVWQTDFWKDMNHVLPNNKKGSRIIITTRKIAIADSCDIVQRVHDSRERDSEWPFLFGFDNCPPKIELCLEYIRSRHGLPLVIYDLTNRLSANENVLSELQRLLDKFFFHFEKNPDYNRVNLTALYQRYVDLPLHIRLCFLYFGVFPKDYLVSDKKLFKLWIAEGFVKEMVGKTLEQVAESYLNELINRNLVQVSYNNYYSMKRVCRVNDFMHDIISSKTKTFEICQVLDNETSRFSAYGPIRRLSIYSDTKFELTAYTYHRVRSLFFFSVTDILMTKSLVSNFFGRFKLLELLDFENAPLDYLPKEVGNFFLLKYLNLRNTKVKKLPKSVGLLLNLQTLDVRNTLMNELPIQILSKLRKLQHLLANTHNNNATSDSIHGVRIKEGIGCLENLQTLITVEAHRSRFGVIEELKLLRQLRWLSISKLTTVIVNPLCSSIEKMTHLESLNLYSANDREFLNLEVISSPPPSLRRLVLKCRLEKLPSWILSLQNLSVLGLSFSRLDVDLLKDIHSLPNLESLWLHRAYTGEQLHFEESGFQKLKQLVLTELFDLRFMKIERGALPLLEELRIGPSIDDFSSDIQNLRNLQVLEYYDMPDECVLRLQPEGGSDYWKVEHVPSVVFRYRTFGRRYMSYKLGEPGLFTHVKGLARTTNVEWHDRPLSFFYNDDDEELATTSNDDWSERISFFSDDIED